MADSPVTVQRFSWPDLCPALLIFRALPTALSMTVLVLALFAVAATPIGWIVMEKLFVTTELTSDLEFKRLTEINRSPYKMVYSQSENDASLLTVLGNRLRGVELVFNSAIESVKGVFSAKPGIGRFLYFFGGAFWTILVWSFFGCAITRAALMRYTRDEPIGIDDAFSYAIDKFLSCFGGISIPFLAIFGLTIPAALIGLLMSTNLGAAIGGLLWVFVLILSLIISVIILGLMFAWPLIISAISCEGQDSFDGMSRAFAYVFQRPIHYFMYAMVAVIFTGVCWAVAGGMIGGVVRTADWATSWGYAGHDDVPGPALEITRPVSGPPATADPAEGDGSQTASKSTASVDVRTGQPTSGLRAFGDRMIRFWNNVARTLGAAFLYGLFWSVAAAMYLLLRKDLDNTEMDEIYLVDDRRTYELPSLKDDESGIPQVDENAVLPAKVDPPGDSSISGPDSIADSG